VEQGEGFLVEMEVEAVSLEIGCIGASTPVMVHSTKVVWEHMDEMVDLQVVNGIEVHKAKEKVWTMTN